MEQKLRTGFLASDRQHRELFENVDSFIQAIIDEKEDEELASLFTFLESYVKNSFTEEDLLLKRSAWPDTEVHIAQHEYFRRRFADLHRDFLRKGANEYLVEDIHHKVVSWMTGHIQNEDKLWSAWIKENRPDFIA
jgi:hemerythrin